MPRFPLLPAALLGGLMFMATTAHAAIIDRVVAVVNGEAVTQSELDERWQQVRDAPGAPASQEALLTRMIELKLQRQRAEALHMDAQPADVDDALANILTDNHIPSLDVLEQVLKAEGRSLDGFRKEIANQITLMRVMQAEVTAKVQLSETELRAYFDAHRPEFVTNNQIRLRQIHLALDNGEESARVLADLSAKVTNRATFLAAEAGLEGQPGIITGAAGEFSREDLIPELADALFALPEGGVSEPITLPNGMALFLVDAIIGGEAPTFERIVPLVRERASAAAAERRMGEWLSELKANAYIEIREL